MRPLAFPLAVVGTAALCSAAAYAHGAAPDAGHRIAAEIRVHPRTGVRYTRMEGDSLAVMRLLRCAPAEREERGNARVEHGRGRAVAINGVGDRLEIPAGAGPDGMNLQIRRRPGLPFRSVEVDADNPVTAAILTMDLTGCEDTAGATVVLWRGGASWDDMGGSVDGSTISTTLPHLSIYAVAGN
jgi:hypothetical protein